MVIFEVENFFLVHFVVKNNSFEKSLKIDVSKALSTSDAKIYNEDGAFRMHYNKVRIMSKWRYFSLLNDTTPTINQP